MRLNIDTLHLKNQLFAEAQKQADFDEQLKSAIINCISDCIKNTFTELISDCKKRLFVDNENDWLLCSEKIFIKFRKGKDSLECVFLSDNDEITCFVPTIPVGFEIDSSLIEQDCCLVTHIESGRRIKLWYADLNLEFENPFVVKRD